jgi:hypothetical protein
MLVRGRIVSLAFVALAAVVSGGSCTDTANETPFPAAPGASQTPGGGDQLGEDEACERLRKAEEKARQHLNCPELGRPDCPFYVRPAGSGCWTYPEASLSACEEAIQAYEFCSDFVMKPCVLTAVAADSKSCPALGAAGETGQGGAGGESGQANGGRGGQVGRGGEGGEANAAASGRGGGAGTSALGGASGEGGSGGEAG